MDFGVYFHVPFCRVQCPYCTFYTVAKPAQAERMGPLLDAFQAEWRRRVRPRLRRGDRLRTLYFGGGTPSDLPTADFMAFLQALSSEVDGGLSRLDEVTVECNPETASLDFLSALRRTGVDRVSLGAQSVHDVELQRLGRGSGAVDVQRALRTTGSLFDNWNADLIVGIPDSNADKLQESLEALVRAGAPHVSFYCLEMPPARAASLGEVPGEALDDYKADLYEKASAWIEAAGYEHYEISNAAKPGFQARHNRAYWQGREYVGIGPGAHSLEAGRRRSNRADMQEYLDACRNGEIPPGKEEILTREAVQREQVLLGLRRRAGLAIDDLPEPDAAARLAADLAQAGLAYPVRGRIQLTSRGWLVADSIILQLFRPTSGGPPLA